MTFRPHEGDSVKTPDGLGIVLQTVGLPDGNGVSVFLTENPNRYGDPPTIYHLDAVEPGPEIEPFEVGDYVTVPGGFPGRVIGRIDGIPVCRYEASRPRTSRHARFPDWQIRVAMLRGR